MAEEPLHRIAAPVQVTPKLTRIAHSRRDRDGVRRYGNPSWRTERMFTLEGDLIAEMAACRNPEWIASAIGMLGAIAGSQKLGPEESFRCLYIIQEDGGPHCKIGVSADPTKRVYELQAANPFPLTLHACLFSPKLVIGQLESGSLRRAAELGIRAQGEWIRSTAEDALRMVLEYARDECVPVCDAETWFQDMRDKTLRVVAFQRRKRQG